jgi:hypothetical protein
MKTTKKKIMNEHLNQLHCNEPNSEDETIFTELTLEEAEAINGGKFGRRLKRFFKERPWAALLLGAGILVVATLTGGKPSVNSDGDDLVVGGEWDTY